MKSTVSNRKAVFSTERQIFAKKCIVAPFLIAIIKVDNYNGLKVIQMRIAIAEDYKDDMEALQQMLEEYMKEKDIVGEISCFSSGDALLEQFEPGMFQCIFLDIYMEGTNGMTVAREIYQKDPSCRLIFATISLTHAVESYEVRAAWYLAKPFQKKQLEAAMDAACSHILRNSRMLTIHVKGAEAAIPYGDIYYTDCERRQTKVHLKEQTIFADEPVQEVLERLGQDERFLLCNRNTIVNMDHIQQPQESDFLLENGSRVPLRQRGRTPLKKAFLAWTLRELRREDGK